MSDIEPDIKEKAARQDRTRRRLLLAIVVFAMVGVVLQFQLAAKRDAAADAAANNPGARATRAMQDADRATLDGDHQAAWIALGKAATALDEGLADRPTAADLQRGRLIVTRRQAHLAEHPAIDVAPGPIFEEADQRARARFEAENTSEQVRSDRLATARERGNHLMRVGKAGEAARATRDAAETVAASAAVVALAGPVQVQLGETWLDAAKAHAAAGDVAEALEAAATALRHAETGRGVEEDPISAAARAYNTAAAAVEIAEKGEKDEALEVFEQQAVEILRRRSGMQPDDIGLRRTLAARLVRRADQAEKREAFDEAEALHREALTVREALAKQFPADTAVRRDLVRGLNQLGAFCSTRDRDADALEMYARAAKEAEGLDAEGRRTRIIAMGNHAQLLGRLDRTREARDVAADAYALAVQRADAKRDDQQAAVDAARAGLRYARLLRAPPGADRARAKTLARAARDRLDALEVPGKRGAEIGAALDDLIKELR